VLHPTNASKRDEFPASQGEVKPNWFGAMLSDVQFWIPFGVLVLSIVFLWFVK